jgi:hydroxypyruvate isomerase
LARSVSGGFGQRPVALSTSINMLRISVLRFAANLDTSFLEAGFLERFACARAAGFEGIECASPYAHDKAELAELLEEHALEYVLLQLPPCDWARGDRGIACLPERRGEFRDGLALAIEYASALGCKRVGCWAGVARDVAPEVALDTFVDNLRFASAALAKVGLQLLIQPINTRDVPHYFLSQSAQALAVIEATKSDNVWLDYDVYHMQVMQGYLVEDVRRCLPKIAHFHIADNPGRRRSTTGGIDYPSLLREIDQLGYTGWIGCEDQPIGARREALPWLHRRGPFA